MASFSDRLKELRNARGMTQQQMADTFGMQVRNYQRIEASNSPSNETLLKFANYFQVSTDYLLGRGMLLSDVWFDTNKHLIVSIPNTKCYDKEELKRKIDEACKRAIAEMDNEQKAI